MIKDLLLIALGFGLAWVAVIIYYFLAWLDWLK